MNGVVPTPPSPSKVALKEELLALLTAELAALEKAQKATLAGATHEEAKPENDKDTRALEQSYLARGQSQRVEEVRDGLARLHLLPTQTLTGKPAVVLGALVTAEDDDGVRMFLCAPYGGGAKLGQGRVAVVTPKSPLGAALMGKTVGDECEIPMGKRVLTLEIQKVC